MVGLSWRLPKTLQLSGSETMAHDQIFLHSFLSGECPHRWSVVPGRILAKLVILAALLQVIPVDVISSLTDPAASEQQTSDCVSLDANMHAAPCWATPWVSACRLADASSRDSEFSHDDVAQSSRIVVAPCGLRSCEKRCSVDWDSDCLLTLVDWNVRLQI
jgi:hypothetical protein